MTSGLKAKLSLLYKFYKYRCSWLPGYLKQQRRVKAVAEESNVDSDTHVMVLMCDHYEPARYEGEKGIAGARRWCETYKKSALKFTDDDGRHPLHSWFYRYDYANYSCINMLSEFCYEGFGEIEFHLHHGYDCVSSFSKTIDEGVRWFQTAGAMITAEQQPKRAFAYIAGNWALDNGRGDPQFSGVDKEIWVLSKYDCYADFTFPAFGCPAQPATVNSIYYATDDGKPKSYNKGVEVTVGGKKAGDLMIFQGPLYVNWQKGRIEYAAYESFEKYHQQRLSDWLAADIHVSGRPEWKFIKLHTHGIQSKDVFSEESLDRLFADTDAAYKKSGFKLHYVTAREAYNIAKAAEAGMTGNPNDYRDFEIKPPANTLIRCLQPWLLKQYTPDSVELDLSATNESIEIDFLKHKVLKITGFNLKSVKVDAGKDEPVVDYVGENIQVELINGTLIKK